jgi:hypothetical protein
LADPGETVDLRVPLRNYGASGAFSARISGTDPYIQVIRSDADYGSLGSGVSKTNSANPFLLKIAANVPEDYQAALSLDIYAGTSLVKTEPLDLNRINPRWGGIHLMDTSGNGYHRMLRLADGRILSVMLHYTSPHGRVTVTSRAPDGTWDEPYFVTPADRSIYEVTAAVDEQMNVYVAYVGTSGEYPHSDVFLTRLDHLTGTWSSERQLTTSGNVSFWPGDLALAADTGETVHLIWKDTRDGIYGVYAGPISGNALAGETLLRDVTGLSFGNMHAYSLGFGSRILVYEVSEREYKRVGTPGGGWGPEIDLGPSENAQKRSEPFVNGADLYRMARRSSDPATTLQKMGATAWAPAQTLFPGSYLGLEAFPPSNSALSLFDADNMEYVSTDGGPHNPPAPPNWASYFPKGNLYGQRKAEGSWSGFRAYDDYNRSYHRGGLMQQNLVNDGVRYSYLANLLLLDSKPAGNYLYRTTEPVGIGRFPTLPSISVAPVVPAGDGYDLPFHLASSHPQGIRFYEYALGTLPGQNDLAEWAFIPDPDGVAHIHISDLAPNQEFYLSVRAHSKGVYSSGMAVSEPLMTGEANRPPVADAGPDRTVAPGTNVTLDGGASSDPDASPQPLAFAWAQVSGPAVPIANAGSVRAQAAPTAAGSYVFRLTVDDGAASASDDVVVTVPLLYTLTTSASPASGGSISGGGMYFPSDNASLVATPAAGFVFANWTGDLTGPANPTTLLMTGDKTVTAVFNPQIRILVKQTVASAAASSNETGHPAADAIDGNAATTRWGSAFSDPQKITFDMGTAKAITTAVLDWETANARNYTLEGSNDPAFASKTVLAAKTNMPTGNHRIDSLPGLAGSYRYYRMNGTARNTANGYSIWEARFYTTATVTVFTITASAGANGAISPSGSVSVNQGSAKTFAIAPAAGFVVDAVLVDGVNQGAVASYTFPNVASNHSISATFKPAPRYTLNVTAANGAVALSPAGGNYVSGTVVTLTATPNAGYAFGSWSGSATGAANPVSVTMNGNKNVTANFTPIPSYTVTASAGANGSVSPAGTVTTFVGTSRTFTMSPAAGYLVNSVIVDGASAGSVAAYTFPSTTTGTHTLSVTFKKDASIPLPGRIEAENYKNGGEGVGYHDLTSGNSGGQYRSDNVDIQATSDAGGGYNVGWIQAGEWLAYDVNVGTAGTYTLTARMASSVTGTKTAVLSVDGVNTATFSFTNASGNQSWQNVAVTGVRLGAGAHVIRVTMSTGNFNLNYVDVK